MCREVEEAGKIVSMTSLFMHSVEKTETFGRRWGEISITKGGGYPVFPWLSCGMNMIFNFFCTVTEQPLKQRGYQQVVFSKNGLYRTKGASKARLRFKISIAPLGPGNGSNLILKLLAPRLICLGNLRVKGKGPDIRWKVTKRTVAG